MSFFKVLVHVCLLASYINAQVFAEITVIIIVTLYCAILLQEYLGHAVRSAQDIDLLLLVVVVSGFTPSPGSPSSSP